MYFIPIRSGVFKKVNDLGGGGVGAVIPLSSKTITLITIKYIVRVRMSNPNFKLLRIY